MSSSSGESRLISVMNGMAMQRSQKTPMAMRKSVMLSSIVLSSQAEHDRIQRVERWGWCAGERLEVCVRFDQVVSELCVDSLVPADFRFEFVDATSK
jgi:hypothetical protein